MQKFTRMEAPAEKAALMAIPAQLRYAEAMTCATVDGIDARPAGKIWGIHPYALHTGRYIRDQAGVYALLCPLTNLVRYVGSSANIGKRYPRRRNGASNAAGGNNSVKHWFRQLEAANLCVKLEVLQGCRHPDECLELAEFWIQWFRSLGLADLNQNFYPYTGSKKGAPK